MKITTDIIHYSHFGEPRIDEDYALVNDSTFAVADGVNFLHIIPYPNPSPAYTAARITVETIVRECSGDNSHNLPGAVKESNKRLLAYNESLGLTEETVDHHKKQFASCVFAAGHIANGVIYLSHLNDCEIWGFDENGQDLKHLYYKDTAYLRHMERLRESGELVPGSVEEHRYVRSEVVNNLTLAEDEDLIGFGVLNGFDDALELIEYDHCELAPGQTWTFFTDGFKPFFEDDVFRKLLLPNDTEKFNSQINELSATEKRFGKDV
ncbi:hypothetical protein KC614_03545, partial [candidate division WWE3 bacterium]|nr:hypothetical protein [candidate division WWE3 bacterium]